MLCPTCEMVYGDAVEGPWVTCEHLAAQPPVHPLKAGLFQMLWDPKGTLDYLRLYPSLTQAFAIFLPMVMIQTFIFFRQPNFQSALHTINLWRWMIPHPYWLFASIFVFQFVFLVLDACTLHIIARLLDGRGRYQSLFSAALLIESAFGWKILIPHSHKFIMTLLWGIECALLILSVSRIYGIGLVSAFWTRILSYVGQVGLVVFSIVMFSTVRTIHQRGSLFAPHKSGMEYLNITPRLDWTVRGLDGKLFSMQQLHGQVTVVNVWATWCGPCRHELPSLEKLAQDLQGSSIHVMAISEESPDVVTRFLKDHPYELAFYTRDKGLPSDFQSEGIPATFILNPEGHIVCRRIGSAQWDDPKIIEYLHSLEGSQDTHPHKNP